MFLLREQNRKDYEGIIAAANGSVKAKQLSAQMIPKFFKYFPELAEQALDQHLYLCEDEELGVSDLRFSEEFCSVILVDPYMYLLQILKFLLKKEISSIS